MVRSNVVVRTALVMIICVFVYTLIDIQVKLNKLHEEKTELSIQLQEATDSISELNLRLSTPLTEEYMERVAREKLNYRNPNDIIFYNDLAE